MSGRDRSGCLWFCGMSLRSILLDDRLPNDDDRLGSFRTAARWHNADTEDCGPRWCTANCFEQRHPPLASASANVSPFLFGANRPVPAVGQRWLSTMTGLTYDIVKHGALLFIEAVRGEKQDGYREVLPSSLNDQAGTRWSYLGPTPPAVSPPGEVLGQGPTACKPLCGQPRSAWARAGQSLSYLPIGHEHVSDPVGWCCEAKWNRGHGPAGTPPAQPVRHKQISTVPTEEGKPSPADATSSPARREWFIGMPNLPKPPLGPTPGIKCSRCLVTSEGGDVHLETCVARDFRPGDVQIDSLGWSAMVRMGLAEIEGRRRALDRPFIPSITDEDLFGKAVR